MTTACLADFMEAVARGQRSDPPLGYGYKAEIELGVGFYRDDKTGCKVLERPVIIPTGLPLHQGYRIFYAYCNKDGVESMLSGQVPPILPATTREPKDFDQLADIAANFGAKDPHGNAKAGGCDYCVALRVPSEIATQAETPGREIWMVQLNLDKVSPFLQGAKEGDAKSVTKYLDMGVPATSVDEAGVSALMMAAMCGSADTCTLLLDKGAEVDGVEPTSGRTPLMFAAQGGTPQVTELLLARKADPTKADKEGQTALMWAAVAGRGDNAKILAGAGGKGTKNKQGFTAKAIAQKMGHSEVEIALA